MRVLGGQDFRRAGRRDGIGHIEDGRDAAEGRSGGAAFPIFLVRIARIAEMHVHIDGARQDMQTAGVESLRACGMASAAPTGQHAAILDRQARVDNAVGRHDLAIMDDEIGVHDRSSCYPSQHGPAAVDR